MNGFSGEYEVTLDSKQRFLLPAGVKKQFAEGENTFVLARGIEECITLYPVKTWEAIEQKLNALNKFDEEARTFKRIFLRGVTEIELDSAGRILVPPTLKEYAGLKKEMIIAGMTDFFEIWEPNKYDAVLKKVSPTKFSELANKLFL
ncbi:division/cell wall cluster transcriptional repressor MraZ [Parasediminibacterium sp. JCM 36343]|uniref:division/cell wall cluster transcriptional repressor MraZ n=1 Tax=Parasediminibacterium sp. JCM 36343 TaxID=3374279 RepID=UPI00397E0977